MHYWLTLDLKDDPALIEKYEFWHRPDNIWPEIPHGIREVGIREMEIFRRKDRLVMFMETDDDFDMKSSMKRLQELPRQKEWESFMDNFQQRLEDTAEGEKWQEMKKIFSLTDCK